MISTVKNLLVCKVFQELTSQYFQIVVENYPTILSVS